MGSEGLSKKMSFSIDVGDGKKLRLIDMAKEDDYLIAYPLFNSLEDLRLSVTLDRSHADEAYKCQGILPCAERLQQNEHNSSMETGRPSYMRKSLAWDSAFFTNDGVLDPDELILMNKGLKQRPLPSVQEDMLLRRSEPALRTLKKNADPHSRIKSSKHVSQGNSRSTLLQSSDKSNKQIARSAEYQQPFLKPPKASRLLKGIPTGRGQTPLTRKDNVLVAKEDNSVQTRAVSSFASTNVVPSNSQPQSLASTSPDISKNYLKRKTESTRSKLSASVSVITPSRYSEKTKRQGTDLRHSIQSLPAISNYSSGKSTSDFIVDRSVIKKSKERHEPNPHSHFFPSLEGEINSPLPYGTSSPFGTPTAPTQSGLRMPSPKMGYFDEEKPVASTATGDLSDIHHRRHRCVGKQTLNRKLTTASDIGHITSSLGSISISAKNEENLSRFRKLCAGKHSRDKIDQSSTLKGEEKQMKALSHSRVDREKKKKYKSKGEMNKENVNTNMPQLGGKCSKNVFKC